MRFAPRRFDSPPHWRQDREPGDSARRNPSSNDRRIFLLPGFLALLLCLGTSCTHVGEPLRPKVDYAAFEKLEESPGSKLVRVFTKLPGNRHRYHYGNWGGPGAEGGEPVDEMDELFRRHDISYDLVHSVGRMRLSDELLVHYLVTRVDPSDLTEHGKLYRQQAITYFRSPLSKTLGKPMRSFFVRQEHPEGLFAEDGSLEEFFNPEVPAERLRYHR